MENLPAMPAHLPAARGVRSLAQGPPKGYPNGGPRLGSRKAIWGFDQGTDSEMIANEGGDAAARMGQDSPKAGRSNP
jgi:hypothetical protein